jgi:hypothetical protein
MSIYHAFIPVVIHHLNGLRKILEIAEQHCAAHKIDQAVMLNLRLFPDMFPLVKQVQIATDMVKGGAARLAVVENPTFSDDESNFVELRARIAKLVEFLSGLSVEQFDGAENRDIQLSVGGREMQFTGSAYFHQWVLPNFYFHKTTTYNLLRHNGVVLTKRDFLS